MSNVSFHKSNGKKFNSTSGLTDNYSGFPPKTIGDHISWDTMTSSLAKIGERLRPVERSTRFV